MRRSFAPSSMPSASRPRFGPSLRTDISPDAFLLDVHGGDSVALVAHLASTTHRPIVVLDFEMRPTLVSAYLESGADAVVAATGDLGECVARLRALTRRSSSEDRSSEPAHRAGGVTIYPESRRVLVEGVPVRLTRTEFNLLAALARRLDEVVTHRSLMSEVWGPSTSQPAITCGFTYAVCERRSRPTRTVQRCCSRSVGRVICSAVRPNLLPVPTLGIHLGEVPTDSQKEQVDRTEFDRLAAVCKPRNACGG
ncbi:MAG: response regulator transcription factor [Dehalococcoidia bacterium]|nr:response regulator transcription factor [Dehalococcoidia bacterium]